MIQKEGDYIKLNKRHIMFVLATIAPLFVLILSVLLFIGAFVAYYHPTVNKKVCCFLGFNKEDKKQEYTTGQLRLYAICAIAVIISGLLIVIALAMLGIG